MQTLIVSFLRVAAAFEIMFHLGFNRHNTRHTWRSNQVHVVFLNCHSIYYMQKLPTMFH